MSVTTPVFTYRTHQMAPNASTAFSLHDLLWTRGKIVGINSAKAFSSPGAIVRAKESRALRPDCTISSLFSVRHNLIVSRIFEMDEDEELRTSSDSFNTRSASKYSPPDFIWVDCQGIRRTGFRITLTLSSSTAVSRFVTHVTNSAAGMTLKTELKQVRAVLSISMTCFSSECALATAEI